MTLENSKKSGFIIIINELATVTIWMDTNNNFISWNKYIKIKKMKYNSKDLFILWYIIVFF